MAAQKRTTKSPARKFRGKIFAQHLSELVLIYNVEIGAQ